MMVKLYAYQHFRTFPYYKVQWWDAISLTWRDVQKAHATIGDAQAAFMPGRTCRVMQINERGRHPLTV